MALIRLCEGDRLQLRELHPLKVKMKLPCKGSWRLRAFAPADAQHLKAWSGGIDYVTVK